jgi:hypothetical protein
MERRAENPVPHFLIVNDDTRFRQEGSEAIRDAKLRGGLPAILCSSGAPKVKLGSICLKSSYMLNHGCHGNSGRAHAANERVININVNNHVWALPLRKTLRLTCRRRGGSPSVEKIIELNRGLSIVEI